MAKWLGVMAVDPGGTTGVAWGCFPLDVEAGPGKRAKRAKRLGSAEVTGSYQWQAAAVVEHWREFEAMCFEAGVGCTLVIEDYITRVKQASSDRSQLMPVRIAACVEGILLEQRVGCVAPMGEQGWLWAADLGLGCIVYQQPSAAKGYATDARLRRWGLWHIGSRHVRDAWRHVLLRVAESTSKTP